MPEQKRCKDCGEVKGADAFYRTNRGYLRARCKPCMSAYNRAHLSGVSPRDGYYRTEKYREFNRTRMSAYVRGPGKERVYARNRQYILADRQRRNAWKAVERAVNRGQLIRPDLCACGRPGRVQAHHDDYSKPLNVLWLCAVCHKARHEWLKGQKAA